MNNETKRDVFDALIADMSHGSEKWRARYDAALPDDLPVIPKAVSEWIKECHHRNFILENMLCTEMRPESVRWWMAFKDGDIANGFDDVGYRRKQETMAKAWLIGVWRVEETGEIVGVRDERD